MGQPTLNAWEIERAVGTRGSRNEAIGSGGNTIATAYWLLPNASLTRSVSKHCDKVSAPEYIGCKKRTQGTETSKYLQERTSTETPQVVASERGPGQWQL